LLLSMVNCSNSDQKNDQADQTSSEQKIDFYYGADLSYVNEMEDCGAIYKNRNNQITDPYQIFKEEGANLIRLRLWHNPQWTDYSDFEDVKRSIQRAKANHMQVLLDFHYSDTWADPEHQQIPSAWIDEIDDPIALGELLYDYTFTTLAQLCDSGLCPDMVQIGNEINPMILQDGELEWPIDWDRNAYLINQGLKAVKDLNTDRDLSVETMLHIAQPENALWWFEQATTNGVTEFDWIGLSYYPKWSEYKISDVGDAFSTLINTYNKKLMVVETAYPFTLNGWDNAGNILGTDALVEGYAATIEGQLNYMNDLRAVVAASGGTGLVYWEPAWVSTNCSTLWGQGSHWENATMFDENNKAHDGISFYNEGRNE
jgi:arabinogalactan endo-1,4-beta-galactosidase